MSFPATLPVKQTMCSLQKTPWVYQNSKNSCDLVNSLPHSSKKNRWSEADKSEFTTLDGYFLWDSPKLQKLRQKCPILEGKNSKICQKEAAKGQKLVQKKFWSTSRPSPLHLVLFEQPWPVARPQGFEWTLRTWTGPMDQTIFEVANARVQVLCISAQYFKLKSLKSSYQIDLDWTIPNTAVIATKTPPAEESLEPRTQMEIGGHLSAILGFTRKLTVIFCILCFLCRSWSFLLGDGDSNGKSFSTESLLYLIYP